MCGVWSEFCGKIFIESQSVKYVEEHEDSEVMYCKYMYYTVFVNILRPPVIEFSDVCGVVMLELISLNNNVWR